MSLKKSIKKLQMRFLPPSSRSFHSATYDIHQENRQLQDEILQLRGEIHQLYEQLDHHSDNLYRKIEKMDSDIAVHDAHIKLYGDVFFRRENESPHEMRKRFFHSLPKADEPFRTFQMCNGKLLHHLNDLCQQNHLEYWLGFGSLVGAAACEGHIPWDDDVDICMMREDAMTLFELLKNDPEYQMTLVYDYYVFVKQFRFSHRNPNIPCFIDISIWDWAADTSEKNEFQLRKLRRQLTDSLPACNSGLDYWHKNPYLFAPGSNYVVQCGPVNPSTQDPDQVKQEIEKIETYYQYVYEQAKSAGIFCDKAHAAAVAFGLENLSEDVPGRRYIWPRDMIFPTQQLLFEGGICHAPNNIKGFCDECFPNWPYLPKDILGHDHFSRELLEDENILEAMRQFISE